MASDGGVRAARGRGGSARRAVYDELRRRIVALELAPGAVLSDSELAATFGVSRTPVRESLILLSDEGLVDIYPQRGTFVGHIHVADVLTAQFVREALECAALADAAPTAQQVDELRRLVAVQRVFADGEDREEFFRLDEQFHSRLMAVSGHGAAWGLVGQAKAQLDRVRRLSMPLDHRLSDLVGQHAAVVEHLAGGDAGLAVAALRAHLRLVLADVETMRAANPGAFDEGEG